MHLKIPNAMFDKSCFRKPKGIGYYNSSYGPVWVSLSRELREAAKRKCQWCCRKFRNTGTLQCHHIACVKYNHKHLLDRRIILVVCDDCHLLLEPWCKIHLDQMLPQIYKD